jgi:hypothetical protein
LRDLIIIIFLDEKRRGDKGVRRRRRGKESKWRSSLPSPSSDPPFFTCGWTRTMARSLRSQEGSSPLISDEEAGDDDEEAGDEEEVEKTTPGRLRRGEWAAATPTVLLPRRGQTGAGVCRKAPTAAEARKDLRTSGDPRSIRTEIGTALENVEGRFELLGLGLEEK